MLRIKTKTEKSECSQRFRGRHRFSVKKKTPGARDEPWALQSAMHVEIQLNAHGGGGTKSDISHAPRLE